MAKRLYVVGIGPGNRDGMTIGADRILQGAEVIVGYTVYVDLVREYYPGAEFLTTGMRREKERCEMAFASADGGRTTAVICSGDAEVYGMAGLVLELSAAFPEVEVIIVPGVTAALSGGALLGAPLGHDFAVISLSDALTPWELIEKRLRAAAESDMVICLYNPESRTRSGYLARACRILLSARPGGTVCGIAGRIGREGESVRILSLRELADTAVDMFSTVFIGSSGTIEVSGRMVTPRGYRV